MILDSSALIAILRGEPEAGAFLAAIAAAEAVSISAASYLETAIVIDSARNPAQSRRFDAFLAENRIEIAPVTVVQAKLAREAYRDFGKGSGHKAGLNFGDCFSFALSSATGRPLLYKGDDFRHTGIETAL